MTRSLAGGTRRRSKPTGVTLEVARERAPLNEQDTRRLWQLLGLLDEDDVFIQLPEWLVETKTDDVWGNPATTFVGYISRETEDAVLFENSSPGRRLMQIAHKIHSLGHGVANTAVDADRRNRLKDKLQEEHRRFEERDDAPYLADEWLRSLSSVPSFNGESSQRSPSDIV